MNDACSRWESNVCLMLAELIESFFPPLLHLITFMFSVGLYQDLHATRWRA